MKLRKVKIIDTEDKRCIVMLTDMTKTHIEPIIEYYRYDRDDIRESFISMSKAQAYCNSRCMRILYDSADDNSYEAAEEITKSIGFDEVYDLTKLETDKRCEEEKKNIFNAIKAAINASNMKVLSNDENSMNVQNDKNEFAIFRITVTRV